MKKVEFTYDSRDNASKIHAVRYLPEDGSVKAVVQIVHGMAEYVERYEELAEFLTGRGFLVTGGDHLGHGGSSAEKDYGYFCEQDPATVVVRDVHRLKKMTQQLFPNVPYVILGHSMGSFILRNYLSRYGSGIQGAIIMGTGQQPKALVKAGKLLASMIGLFKGRRYVSNLMQIIAFGSYCDAIKPVRSNFDWLTKENDRVDRYIADPKCGFTFTLNGFQTLFELIDRSGKMEDISLIPKDLPVFFMAGSEDPVGDYGKGVKLACDAMAQAEMKKLSMKMYENDRHEILNETDRAVVMEDIYAWIVENVL